jgi:mevalonate kinase
MLAGEYGVVVGGSALCIPFHKFSARISSISDVPRGKKEEASLSLEYISYLYDYIQKLGAGIFHAPPDLDLFRRSLHTYWLELNIPVGYGLGSSGTVSAAIYDLFFPQSGTLSLQQQKEDLALIESYFHGRSSGVDALTCHADTPLLFRESGSIEKVGFDTERIRGGYRFFLLDSGERFDTGPLVQHFLKQLEDPVYEQSIRDDYLPLNQKLIETLLGEREADPGLLLRLLSDYQMEHFRRMIPDRMLDVWIEGQVSNEYYLKLNGSGGGYMLGLTHHSSMETLEERWGKDLVWER